MTTKAKLVLDARAQVGEGALWYEGQLQWIDIEGRSLNFFDPESGKNAVHEMPQRIGTVVPMDNGRVAVALEQGIYTYDPGTDTLHHLLTPEGLVKGIRCNDGKCDPAGRFWVGSMGLDFKPEVGRLYVVDLDGNCKTVLDKISISNGLVWSNDRKKFYYIDTPTRRIDIFDYDLATGSIDRRRSLVEIPEKLGYPDGMAIDRDGHLWVAMWGGSAIICFSGEDGSILQHIEVPALQITSCAFGGPELRDLYITSARLSLNEAALQRYPHSGGLFVAHGVGQGVPAYSFQLKKG